MENKVRGELVSARRNGTKKGIHLATGKFQQRFYPFIVVIMLLFVGALFSSPLHAAVSSAQKSAIAAGMAAGTEISTLLKNAVASGLTPEEAVQELIRAGADPGKVVYEAITAKYSAEGVTKSAGKAVMDVYGNECLQKGIELANCQSLNSQVSSMQSAALQAGVPASNINGWLAAANVPPTVIANAGTQSGQSPAPAEGPSGPTPSGPALTSLISGAGGASGGYSIGGAGVGSPTKPASTYIPK
jgi:hypothetical protein